MVVLWADPSKEPFILSTEREPLQQTWSHLSKQKW
jgi:hypothetical protein